MLKRRYFKLIATLAVIAIAVFGCYHKLLLRNSSGLPAYNAVRWGLKTFMYPRLIFNSDALRSGIFPLWNPYPFGGAPWVSNFQATLFHPVNLLIILLFGYSAEVLQMQLPLIFFTAGVAMYFCAREFKASLPASLLSAISFLSCGFFVGNASFFPQINTLAVLPFGFLSVRRMVRRPSRGSLAAGGLAFSVMIFSGFPTMAFFFISFSGCYGLLELGFNRSLARPAARRGLLYLLVLFLITGLMSAPLLLPALESYGLITRPDRSAEDALALPRETVGQKSLAPGHLLSLVFPYLGLRQLSAYRLAAVFRNCSIGLIGLCFAVYYLIFSRERTGRIIALLLLLSLLFALGFNTPVYSFLYRWLPPFRMVSHPAMDFRPLFLFFFCLAGGLGMDRFLKDRSGERGRLLRSVALLVGLALPAYLAAGRFYGFSPGRELIANYFWLIATGIFIGAVSLRFIPGKYLAAGLVALAVLDASVWTNRNFRTVAVPVSAATWERIRAKEEARERDVVTGGDFLRKKQYPSRKGVMSMFWKYFSDSGNDGTRLKSFQGLMATPGSHILSEDFRVIPIYAVRVLDSNEEILDEIKRGTDLRRIGLVRREDIASSGLENKLKALSPPEKSEENFRGEITYYSPDEIRYRLNLSGPALIFFNEIYYPGWRLREGEIELPLFEVNYAFRGTYLEGGEHDLIMRFSPRSYYLGLLVSVATALFLLAAVIIGVNHRGQTLNCAKF